MTLETSTAHKEEIHPAPPYTTILLRNSLSKQAGSATCLKGQQPSSAFYQGHWRKYQYLAPCAKITPLVIYMYKSIDFYLS